MPRIRVSTLAARTMKITVYEPGGSSFTSVLSGLDWDAAHDRVFQILETLSPTTVLPDEWPLHSIGVPREPKEFPRVRLSPTHEEILYRA